MPSLSEISIQAFRDELHKEAGFGSFVAKNKGMLQNAGSAGGVGALAGGVMGGLSGGVGGYREARNAGEGVGVSALHGLSHGLGSAASGAGKGALIGAGLGAMGSRMGMGSPSRLTSRNDIIGSAARGGQRQVHALTGMLSPSEVEGIRGGAYDARNTLGKLQAAGKPTERAAKGLDWADRAQGAGLTSLPGYVNAVRKDGIGRVLSTSAREQYYNMPAMGAAMIGLPALSAAKTLASPESPDGPGKGERIGRSAGDMLGGVMGGVMPLAGGAVLGKATGTAGQAVGRAVDRMRGRKPQPVSDLGNATPLEPTEAQTTPSERITSPSAAGQQKDVGL